MKEKNNGGEILVRRNGTGVKKEKVRERIRERKSPVKRICNTY
jgi:hypothetical protein